MAMAPSGRNGHGRAKGYVPMSEINVTPLVDVMLVLLVVFMITAPLLTAGVPVDLPKTQARNFSDPSDPLIITVNAGGDVFVQESAVDLANLVPLLIAITDANPEARIYVRGDRAIHYGRIMQVMGSVNAAGFTRVALVAELPQSGER